MSLEDDLPLPVPNAPAAEPVPDEPAEAEPPVAVEPRVVLVQYRRGWSLALVPPLLILMAVLVVLRLPLPEKYRALRDRGVEGPTREAPASVDANAPNATPLAETGPVVARVVEDPGVAPMPGPEFDPPMPAPPPLPAEDPPAIGFVPPIVAGPPDPVAIAAGPVPAGFVPNPFEVPRPEAPPGRVDLPDEDVEAEARRVRAERRQLLRAKDDLLAKESREASQRQRDEVLEQIRTIEESRPAFLNDLRAILRDGGPAAGPRIEALCARSGLQTPPQSMELARVLFQSTSYLRLGTRDRVEKLRSMGWPEPAILESLAKQEFSRVGSRNGPKTQADSKVIAARMLLSAPLTPTRPAPAARDPR